jgi:hypothetical protein
MSEPSGDQPVALPVVPEAGLTVLMNRFIVSQVRQRLRFVWGNDAGWSREDLCHELQRKALEASRTADARGYSERHRSNSMRIAVQNYCSNLAQRNSGETRGKLRRTRVADDSRAAWLVDTRASKVVPIEISLKQQHRRGRYVLVRTQDGNQWYRHLSRIHDSEADANQALAQWLQRGQGRRKVVIDLAPDHDDFGLVAISIDAPRRAPDGDQDGSLHDSIAKPPRHRLDISFQQVHQPRVRQCLDLLLHYPDDPLFCQFCRARGEDPAALGDATLMRRAMEFCGTDLKEMRGALAQVYREIKK